MHRTTGCISMHVATGSCSTFHNSLCHLSNNVMGRPKVSYIVQCFERLVLRDKLHEKLHSVTAS